MYFAVVLYLTATAQNFFKSPLFQTLALGFSNLQIFKFANKAITLGLVKFENQVFVKTRLANRCATPSERFWIKIIIKTKKNDDLDWAAAIERQRTCC